MSSDVVEGDDDGDLLTNPHAYTGQIRQHWVPPRSLEHEIPFFVRDEYDEMESMIQDKFHSLHVQGGKHNSIAANELFAKLRTKAESTEETSEAFGSGVDATSGNRRRNLLRGLFQASGFFENSDNQSTPRGLSFISENDFVVTGEVDYSDRPGNGTDLEDSNSTRQGNDTLVDDNATSAIDPEEEGSSSVLTKANGTENGGTGDGSSPGTSEESTESGGESSGLGGDEQKSSSAFHPIRIRAVLSDFHGGGEHLDPKRRQILLEEIVQPALLAWSEALRVPVQRPDKNLTLDPSQWLDGTTCGPGIDSGLPTAHVPLSHLKYGVPETDLVVYLDLGFVYEPTPEPTPMPSVAPPTMDQSVGQPQTDPSPISAPSVLAPSVETSDPPDSPLLNFSDSPVASHVASFEGSSITDGEWNVSTSPSAAETFEGTTSPPSQAFVPKIPKSQCAGDYLASSVYCSTNELDRPTAAMLHICIGPEFFDSKYLPRNIMTIMHELGHALGFNLQSLAHFRRSDGSPVTPRDATGAIPQTLVECTGPRLNGGRPRAMMQLPSREILDFRIVRGGVRVAEVVTPSVAQVERNHFDCQKLEGAELESGEALPLSTNPGEMSCIGNHWERRLFKMDIMNPLVEELRFEPLISLLTLAYFADSGWYQVDLSRAAFPAIWGRAAGCAFVEEPCIQPNGQVVSGSDELFCNSLSTIDNQGFVTSLDGCSPDLTRKAACTMSQYDGELPPEYQYFTMTYGSNVGGQDPFMDYCPVYNGLKNGLCSDPRNEGIIRVSPTERVGSRNSRCLSSHSTPSGSRMALCLRIACVVTDKSLRVQVEGKWHRCPYEGKPILTQNRKETIICVSDSDRAALP